MPKAILHKIFGFRNKTIKNDIQGTPNLDYNSPVSQTQSHRTQARIVRGLILGAICGCLVLLFTAAGWFKGIERATLDAMFWIRGRIPPSQHVIIVEADESTLARYGPWPFPRSIYADLTRELHRMGAKTIVFDIQFSTPSNNPQDDQAFARASQEAGNVIQAGVFALPGMPSYTGISSISRSLNRDLKRYRLTGNVNAASGVGLNAVSGSIAIPPLLNNAAGFGHITVNPEWDGALRRIPHYIRYKGMLYPSLALAAAAHFKGVHVNDIQVTPNKLSLGLQSIALDTNGETLINWCGPTTTFPSYTFQQVLTKNSFEKLPDDTFENAVVVVGITHPGAGSYERYATPFSSSQPAVEIHANAIDNILENRTLNEAPAWLPVVLLLVLSLVAGALTSLHGARQGALWILVFNMVLWAMGLLLMAKTLWYMPVSSAIAASLLACAVTLGYRQWNDAQELKIADERYELALQGANDGIWDWNLKTGEVYYSTRWQMLLGLQDGVIHSQLNEWMSRVHPDDLSKLNANLQRHLNGDTPHFEDEHRIRHADSSYRWVLARGLRVLQDGKPTRIAGSLSDITARKQAEDELLHNAFYDNLTGLPNRALFIERLGRAIARASREQEYVFAVLFLDLDRFKVINDSLGHAVGDQLLLSVAQRLESCLRPGDTAARLGGDEFTLLLDDISHIDNAMRIARRIQELFHKPFEVQQQRVFSTASIGIAICNEREHPIHYQQPEDILRDADTALYRAKASGRACHEVFDEAMRTRAISRLQMEAELRHALEHEEFRAYYQPLVDLRSGDIIGFEALARWQHPERGLIAPEEFVSLAEETGLIVALDEWVLRESCRQLQEWQELIEKRTVTGQTEEQPFIVDVNLSNRHFSDPCLVDKIKSILDEFKLPPRALNLEITESVLLENIDYTTMLLKELKLLGVQLAIDDFGTGYSSLAYLHRLPLDVLKIDQSFVSHLTHSGENTEIAQAIISLARSMKMTAIAEGVETATQMALLQKLGCDFAQGYLFSHPLSAADATQLLQEHQTWDVSDTSPLQAATPV